jgi:hypothetical protein
VEFESPHPAAASPAGSAERHWLAKNRPHRPVELGAIAATCEHPCSRRPCHPALPGNGPERGRAATNTYLFCGWTMGWRASTARLIGPWVLSSCCPQNVVMSQQSIGSMSWFP